MAAQRAKTIAVMTVAMTSCIAGFAGCSYGWDALRPEGNGNGATSSSSSSSASSGSSGLGGAGGMGGGDVGGNGGAGGSAGTGGAGGGGPASVCGGVGLLTDDFSDGVAGINWNWAKDVNASVTEQNGTAIVAFNNDPNGLYAALQSKRYYDLRGGAISVKVAQASSSANTRTFFIIKYDDSHFIQFEKVNGNLQCVVGSGGNPQSVQTLTYSATDHLYWRIREDGTNIIWETSADGANGNWVERTKKPTSELGFAIDSLRVDLGIQTVDNMQTVVDEAHFDDVNGGGAPSGQWCLASTMSDDFANGTTDRIWSRSYTSTGCLYQETGGKLQFTVNQGASGAYCAYVASTAYDLTGNGVVIEVPELTSNANSAEVFLRIGVDAIGRYVIRKSGSSGLEFGLLAADTSFMSLKTLTYVPASHRWWRVHEQGGAIYWEVSSDGKSGSWSQQYSAPTAFSVKMVDIEIGAGAFASAESQVTASFDNYNLAP